MEGSSRPKLKSEIKIEILEYLGRVSKKEPPVAEDFLEESIKEGVGLSPDYDIDEILKKLIDEEEAIESREIELTLYLPKNVANLLWKRFRFGKFASVMGAYTAIIISLLTLFFYYQYFYVFTVNDLNETVSVIPAGSDVEPFLKVYKEGHITGIIIALVGGLILAGIIQWSHRKVIEYADGFIKEYGEKNVRIFNCTIKVFSVVILVILSLIVVLDQLIRIDIDFLDLLEKNIVYIIIGLVGLAFSSFKVAEVLERNR